MGGMGPFSLTWRSAVVAVAVLLFGLLLVWLIIPAGSDNYVPTVLTPEERTWLSENPEKLTLFYNTDFPPIEFAGEDGSFTGLGADVVAEVERRLGIEFVKIPCRDWNMHLQALADGDCAVAPTIVRTDDREDYAYFTVPYARVPVVIITTQSASGSLELEDLPGLSVAVVSGFATEEYVRQAAGGAIDVVPMWNVPEAIRAVAFGEVDAFVENLAVAAYYTDLEGLSNLRVAGTTDYFFEWSIGVSREYPLLFSSVQKALADISHDELEGMYRDWISMDTGRSISPGLLRTLRITALFTAILLVCLSVISFYLRRRLNEKVRTLEKAQKELLEQSARLQHAEKMEALGSLAGGIAHDFNNILQVMGGYAQLLLKRDDIPPEERASLEHIDGAGRRAASLISQLMAFSRHIEFKKVPVDVNGEIRNAAEVLGQTIPRMIRITLRLREGIPPILADPVHLEQIVFNLAGNAVDAMPDGGEIEISTDKIELTGTPCEQTGETMTGKYVILTVSDTGCGIPEEVKEKIFNPFFTTKEPGRGTGLGLASVYGIVMSLDGCIRCLSGKGRGTIFTILLPTAGDEPKPRESGKDAFLAPAGRGETILVVDDEPHITGQSEEFLSALGYRVITASTGEEALQKHERQHIDLVLLDLNMPGMGGYRCLQELKRRDPGLNVLIVSGHSEFDTNINDLLREASGFIRKPYRLTALAERIRETLHSRS